MQNEKQISEQPAQPSGQVEGRSLDPIVEHPWIEESDVLQAHEIVWSAKLASTSLIQRRMRIGYIRASCIIEELERRGVVGPFRKDAPREVLKSPNGPS